MRLITDRVACLGDRPSHLIYHEWPDMWALGKEWAQPAPARSFSTNAVFRPRHRKCGVPVTESHAGKLYRRRFVSTRLAATLLADGAPCFAICACPALVIKRDCSYISIHFSLEIAEISLPIASSGKSSGDSK